MTNVVNIRGRRAGTATVPGRTPMLLAGVYDVWADGDLSIAVGTETATIATTPEDGKDGPLDLRTLDSTNGYRVAEGNTIAVRVSDNGDVIGFDGAATNAYWHKVD